MALSNIFRKGSSSWKSLGPLLQCLGWPQLANLAENVLTKDCLSALATASLTESEKFRDTGGENVLKNVAFLLLG